MCLACVAASYKFEDYASAIQEANRLEFPIRISGKDLKEEVFSNLHFSAAPMPEYQSACAAALKAMSENDPSECMKGLLDPEEVMEVSCKVLWFGLPSWACWRRMEGAKSFEKDIVPSSPALLTSGSPIKEKSVLTKLRRIVDLEERDEHDLEEHDSPMAI